MANIIFLIGMPAVGKSYWGGKIAQAHALQFIDLDVFIAQQERAGIPALFASYGENGFRAREQKYLKQVITNAAEDTIVACGGGTPCFADNIAVMKAAATVIYLEAGIPFLLDNLKKSDDLRPLLKGKANTGTYLDGLLRERKKIYEQAHYILQAKNISLATFDKIITACISPH